LGLKVISTPKVSVEHYSEASLDKFAKRKDEYMYGQWILLNKWQDDPSFRTFMGKNIDVKDVKLWLEENSEYAKGF